MKVCVVTVSTMTGPEYEVIIVTVVEVVTYAEVLVIFVMVTFDLKVDVVIEKVTTGVVVSVVSQTCRVKVYGRTIADVDVDMIVWLVVVE
jgi:hypothetical protein